MMLSVAGLSFSYPSRPVLRDVDFDLSAGDFLAVLGVNGAGKSTLLKCVNRILNPGAGVVLVQGEPAARLSRRELARRIGYVAQRQATGGTTVFDAVLLGRKPHIQWEASRKDLEVVQRALETLELEEYALRYTDELSGGEQQKVVIARALAQEPRVLLLDEPTSSLDLKNQLEVARIIRRVATQQRIGAVVSVHDLNLAIRFANKFLLLKDGEVFAAGGLEVMTPETIESVYSVPVAIQRFAGVPVVVPV
ncbi:MAG: ABC transporter ATP-binding protein [Dactylosporangium sp.]|nr:ABC transporter ATP-binding protein [Dactylosporangium sp.]